MNKRLLTLSMVGLLTVGLASCSDVKQKEVDGKQVIVTIKDTDYTADELLSDYAKDSAGVNAFYNAIYDVLVRDHESITDDMKQNVDTKIDSFVKSVRSNANSNGKTYKAQLSDELEEKGLESLEELREVYMLEQQKTKFEDSWYESHEATLKTEYIAKKSPYHIRHILVKTNNAGTSLYDGKISEDEAIKLSNVIKRLADGSETFGQVAQQASDDTGSAAKYGSVGIMDQDTGFVNEFKLGIFAYDAYLNSKNADKDSASKLNIPTKVLDESADADKNTGLGGVMGAYDVKTTVTSVNEIPYGKVLDLEKYADTDDTINNKIYVPELPEYEGNWGTTINDSYYPRNILFNNYFNDHGLSVIVNDGTFTGSDKNWKSIPELSSKPVLTDGQNPILVARAGSGDSYQGIHLMVIEQSPFWYDSADLEFTTFGKDATPTQAEFLNNYYSTAIPASSSTDVSNDQRYVTFVKSNRDTYSSRATEIENLINGFDSNVSYKLFEELAFNADGSLKAGLEIDEDILTSIKELIASKRAASEISLKETNLDAWTSYVQLLKLQDAQKAAKQLGETYIDLYVENYSK